MNKSEGRSTSKKLLGNTKWLSFLTHAVDNVFLFICHGLGPLEMDKFFIFNFKNCSGVKTHTFRQKEMLI